MKLKIISEIRRGLAFHYYGRPDRVFVKVSEKVALAPSKALHRVSPSTLVVPHEGKYTGHEMTYDERQP